MYIYIYRSILRQSPYAHVFKLLRSPVLLSILHPETLKSEPPNKLASIKNEELGNQGIMVQMFKVEKFQGFRVSYVGVLRNS